MRSTPRLVALGAVALAAALRFSELGARSYWRDEVFTVNLARLPFGSMLHGIRTTEGTPPVYYVVAWVWSRVFGSGEAGLRSLSALLGTLAVVAIYVAARPVLPDWGAAAAALLAAVSPALVWYSQEARAYELGVLAVAVSLAAVSRIRALGFSRTRLAVWTLAACLGVATHYFTVFALAPEAVWLLVRLGRRHTRELAVSLAAVSACGAALLPLLVAQRGNPAWIGSRSLLRRFVDVPVELLAGPQPTVVGLAAPLGLVAAAAAVGLALRPGDLVRRAGVRFTIFGAAAILTPLLLAFAGVDFFLARNLLFALPALLVAETLGLLRLPRSAAIATVALACAVSLAIDVVTAREPKYGREDWRAAIAALGPARPGQVFVLSPYGGIQTFLYYRPDTVTLTERSVRAREVDVIGLPGQGHAFDQNPRPPHPARRPSIEGFALVRTIERRYYTIEVLRSAKPEVLSASTLLGAALDPSPALVREVRTP